MPLIILIEIARLIQKSLNNPVFSVADVGIQAKEDQFEKDWTKNKIVKSVNSK